MCTSDQWRRSSAAILSTVCQLCLFFPVYSVISVQQTLLQTDQLFSFETLTSLEATFIQLTGDSLALALSLKFSGCYCRIKCAFLQITRTLSRLFCTMSGDVAVTVPLPLPETVTISIIDSSSRLSIISIKYLKMSCINRRRRRRRLWIYTE